MVRLVLCCLTSFFLYSANYVYAANNNQLQAEEMENFRYNYGDDALNYYKFQPNRPFQYDDNIQNDDDDCDETTTTTVRAVRSMSSSLQKNSNRWITRNKLDCKKEVAAHCKGCKKRKPIKPKKPVKPIIPKSKKKPIQKFTRTIVKKYFIYKDTVTVKNCTKRQNCEKDESCDCENDSTPVNGTKPPIILRCE